jgi:hypothetical protein
MTQDTEAVRHCVICTAEIRDKHGAPDFKRFICGPACRAKDHKNKLASKRAKIAKLANAKLEALLRRREKAIARENQK